PPLSPTFHLIFRRSRTLPTPSSARPVARETGKNENRVSRHRPRARLLVSGGLATGRSASPRRGPRVTVGWPRLLGRGDRYGDSGMTVDSSELDQTLRQAADGDGQALGTLLARHQDRLRRMVALRLDRRLQGRIDPSDVIQEAFLEASARLADYLRNPSM